jgi:diguanylate cyclase
MCARRSSATPILRKSRGRTPAAGIDHANNIALPPPAEPADTDPAFAQSAQKREEANLAREESVHAREAAAHAREGQALQREGLATEREHDIHEVLAGKAAMLERAGKLREANEQLVIASVQLQIAAEAIERSNAEMAHFANHDFLTNLPNRMQLADRISQAIALAKRHNDKLAVLFLDLDRFKTVNDTYGHAVGDELLRAVAHRLKSMIRSSDTVSRQGGDEFVMLLGEVNDENLLSLKIEKLHEVITAPYDIAGNSLDIGSTIGISVFPKDGEDTETLLRNADTAMYHAKKRGRNKYLFFTPDMHDTETKRLHIESGLYQALQKHQFVLFYQAQVNLESGAITGVEALIRWQHPREGLLLPSSFIPFAEENGAIVPIGRWVLGEACRQAHAWMEAGLDFNVISVNISAREFENEQFLDNVRAVLQESGLAHDRLELELTETVLMKSIECTAKTLHDLRAMGVKISIDDFGTGYSSLSYLKRFPVDTMKIDQTFVRDIAGGDDDILLNAIIGIGKSLHHRVVAEGIETANQVAFLRNAHCVSGQGFYLNVPMMAKEFTPVLKQGLLQHTLE